MQIPKILNVAASDHKLLTIIFTNGEKKIYDVSRLWDNEMFAPLKNPSFFKNVKIEKGGYAVYWNDNIDISEYELWKNGKNSQLLTLNINYPLHEFSEAEKIYDTNTIINLIISVVFEN